MARNLRAFAAVGALLVTTSGPAPTLAQKSGGVLKIYHRDSPASMSILEEATNSTEIPMMGVFNNLVLYKQDVPQNSLQSIVPDLAPDWAWSEDGTELTFRLRQGVKWHDGQPFTANDVKCTWDLLLGKSPEKLRANPRKAWYQNVEAVTADADLTATFHLKRPQPAIIAMLASGYAPVYPCHVSPCAAGIGVEPGPQGVHRHPHRGARRHRRGHAAAAGRGVGHAAGHAQDLAGL